MTKPNLTEDTDYIAGYVVLDLYDDGNGQPRYGPFESYKEAEAFAALIGDEAYIDPIYKPSVLRDHVRNTLEKSVSHA